MVILVLVSLRNVGVDQIFPIVMGILLVILFTLGIFRMRILRRKSLEKDSEDDHPN
jgi:Sec-independent protein secretion pathway component TatC